jgi:hypothetical protein
LHLAGLPRQNLYGQNTSPERRFSETEEKNFVIEHSDAYTTALTDSHQLDTSWFEGVLRGIGHGVVFVAWLLILGSILLSDANLGLR